MSHSDHSSIFSKPRSSHLTHNLQLSWENATLLNQLSARGTQKVKYHGESDWDFHLDAGEKPIDLSLILPHYRARNQPIEHRMTMSIANDSAPIKLKVCRNFQRCKFFLEVVADTSDVTIWLPSDFKGQIQYKGRPSFSAGFINRIMRNVRFTERVDEECHNEDDVVVSTEGRVTFRMWDVQTCAPEVPHKECFQRLFSCRRKAPETTIDWDFLLKD